MIHCEESGGGWFRTGPYQMLLMIECRSMEEFCNSWNETLREIDDWRQRRGRQARQVTLQVCVEANHQMVAKIQTALAEPLLGKSSPPTELAGLRFELALFQSPQMRQWVDLILYPAEET